MLQIGGRLGLTAEPLNLGLAGQPTRIIFNATVRFRLDCRAFQTTPMPPRPISSSNS
jgi:hypothetical protein